MVQVSAFGFDKQKGELRFINKQPSGGDNPAYVSVDSTGKWVVTANYSGGNVTVLSKTEGGALAPSAQVLAHEGYGVNVQRQEQPHPHSAVFSPDEKFVYVPDLGNDSLYSYRFDGSSAQPLTPTEPPYWKCRTVPVRATSRFIPTENLPTSSTNCLVW